MDKVQFKNVQLPGIEADALDELETYLESELLLIDDIKKFPNRFPNIDYYEELFYSNSHAFTVRDDHVDSLLLIDLNDCEFPHTVIVDIFEIGNVIIGEVFLDKTNYEVEPLRPRLYDVHGVLYSKGYEIDESYRLLDLRPKQPVRLVFSRILFYVIVSLVSVIIFAALLNRLRKRSEYGFRGHY